MPLIWAKCCAFIPACVETDYFESKFVFQSSELFQVHVLFNMTLSIEGFLEKQLTILWFCEL